MTSAAPMPPRICAKCGASNNSPLPFCLICKTPLQAARAVTATKSLCNHCGAEWPYNAEIRFCFQCGKGLPETCSNCHRRFEAHYRFCPYCGKLAQAHSEV